VRAALPDENAFDCGAANSAGFAGALVDLEIVLKAAAAIDPVDAGPVAANAFLQYVTHRQQEPFGIASGEAVGEAQRVQPCLMQGLVGVDVAHACQKMLVEQQGFDLAFVVHQTLVEDFRGEGIVQWLGTELVQKFGRVAHQPYPPKFARVDEHQALPAGEVEDSTVMR